MTREEYESNYLQINGMIITPEYTTNIFQQEVVDEETGEVKIIDVEDYTITKTAQQVYDEGMEIRNNPLLPQPTQEEQKIEELEQQNAMLLECVLEMSAIIYA